MSHSVGRIELSFPHACCNVCASTLTQCVYICMCVYLFAPARNQLYPIEWGTSSPRVRVCSLLGADSVVDMRMEWILCVQSSCMFVYTIYLCTPNSVKYRPELN